MSVINSEGGILIDRQFMRSLGYLVIEGPAGVGKTSLARKLSETFNSGLVLEQPDENPFLARFYQNRRQYALPTQLSFLFDRIRRLEGLHQQDLFHPHWVLNFFLERDLLFAQLTLDTDEFELYRHVYEQLAPKVSPPGLVIFLQASVPVLQRRLRQRHLPIDQKIPADYLAELVDSYARFFLQYNNAPLLMINSESVDFMNSEADYRALLEYLPTVRRGRHFFNPLASAEMVGLSP
jgi:deoxyadenosine/deoxycytidine kinase